jgi:hypothetical protein
VGKPDAERHDRHRDEDGHQQGAAHLIEQRCRGTAGQVRDEHRGVEGEQAEEHEDDDTATASGVSPAPSAGATAPTVDMMNTQ